MEIIEGNRIIAKFMASDISFENGYLLMREWFGSQQVKYHISWNWLMPVITKCIKKGIWHSDYTNQLHDGLLEQDIEQCWTACINFIKELK